MRECVREGAIVRFMTCSDSYLPELGLCAAWRLERGCVVSLHTRVEGRPGGTHMYLNSHNLKPYEILDIAWRCNSELAEKSGTRGSVAR